jgi:hypothetical protein
MANMTGTKLGELHILHLKLKVKVTHVLYSASSPVSVTRCVLFQNPEPSIHSKSTSWNYMLKYKFETTL